MKARTRNTILSVFPVLLLISACIGTRSISEVPATLTSLPSKTPPIEPTGTPIAIPGSFADFQVFAAQIAAALQDKNTSFFEEHATSSRWLCLGEETVGVCKDIAADTTLEGIPVTHDWATYKVYSREDYKEAWQSRFASSAVQLAAVANRFGDNPLMPMAGQSFLAILSVAEADEPLSIQEVRVLFFEYRESDWRLAGELVTVQNAEAWLNNDCPTCYDTWVAWAE